MIYHIPLLIEHDVLFLFENDILNLGKEFQYKHIFNPKSVTISFNHGISLEKSFNLSIVLIFFDLSFLVEFFGDLSKKFWGFSGNN